MGGETVEERAGRTEGTVRTVRDSSVAARPAAAVAHDADRYNAG